MSAFLFFHERDAAEAEGDVAEGAVALDFRSSVTSLIDLLVIGSPVCYETDATEADQSIARVTPYTMRPPNQLPLLDERIAYHKVLQIS
ncbi:unnamed protein product [Timema podura]|uniref:Uncharacterized protein n=1 Tax=Timema podura TaxID=61482 RepID=A0ABN7NM03_TIMPD|nr:unnamed protein product [Timema podura]